MTPWIYKLHTVPHRSDNAPPWIRACAFVDRVCRPGLHTSLLIADVLALIAALHLPHTPLAHLRAWRQVMVVAWGSVWWCEVVVVASTWWPWCEVM